MLEKTLPPSLPLFAREPKPPELAKLENPPDAGAGLAADPPPNTLLFSDVPKLLGWPNAGDADVFAPDAPPDAHGEDFCPSDDD